ncbi:MAG: hypothetical protein VX992_07010, partial [Acidobacteriota bacterium]|nr:hypothetical protein [Acidobacteriota bacterium]
FAFSTYFFSPFEGGLDADVAGLVPRRVQFFAAKAHLDRDFDPFPRLASAAPFLCLIECHLEWPDMAGILCPTK